MELERIEALLALMQDFNVAELELEEEGSRIRLNRNGGAAGVPMMVPAPAMVAAGTGQVPASATPAVPSGHLVKSPMVGTFYRAAKPGSPPFVSVGDRVQQGQVLCIVEAMKLMNEIEAEVDGTIAEICVENAQPVQFGQEMFRIEPA